VAKKLYWHYGAMNCGKSTHLLQVAHNYEERGMRVLLMKPAIDSKGGAKVVTRIGASRGVDLVIEPGLDVLAYVRERQHDCKQLSCVLVDEAQFLTPAQVTQLYYVTLELDIPVMCYGLKTDFQTRAFPGSIRLADLAHTQTEIKTICRCGRKAQFNARFIDGRPVYAGEQVAIDGEGVTYESMCGACYIKKVGSIQ
jgi:thymidine kinase